MKSTVVDESLSSYKPMYCSREYQTSTRLNQQYEKSTLNYTHALLYADDTTIIVTGQNLRFMSIEINKDLEALCQWFIDNKLTLYV